MESYYFISYSKVDGVEFARRLADGLLATPPTIPVWLDERELQPGPHWDDQIVRALQQCSGLILVMTLDSVQSRSECKHEWSRALRYKKPVIPLLAVAAAEVPYRLESRQHVDFTGNYAAAFAKLRSHVLWLSSPEGLLHNLEDRLAEAERDLPRASDGERARIQDEMTELGRTIAAQRQAIAHPEAAARKTELRIDSGLQRVRAPAEPIHGETQTKFINPPPTRAPTWFQNRHVETSQVGAFLKEPGLRLMTVVGRGGVGKTAMVCRLLKAVESGHLPDDGGPLQVDGIVYLSPKGLRQVNLGHLFQDLSKLLPSAQAELLEEVYRNAHLGVAAKMQRLLGEFASGCTVALLDNFEEVVDPASGKLLDRELQEALQTLLEVPEHGVKVLITTRVAPKPLQLVQPGRQRLLELDEGLASPFAENLLRAMDADGKLGFRDAPDTLLARARRRTLGYPRALEALHGILAVDRSTTVEEVLEEAERVLPQNVVQALVGEAFSRLDIRAQQVMQALAILSAPCPETAVDFVLQPYLPDIDSAPILRQLVNMRFARREAGRFHLHQADRSYALERVPLGEPSDRKAEPLPFTRYALLRRAAEYFEQSRTPRESWKSITDLEPQLAEFELRMRGEERDAAATVLNEIAFDYLMLWGHVRQVAQLHERLQGRLTDPELICASLSQLGVCYSSLGDYSKAIEHHEQYLAIARDIGDRQGEGTALGNLGLCYHSLGDYSKAIEHHEQSLDIARDIGNRQGEGAAIGNLGLCHYDLGDYSEAIELHGQHLAIARDLGNRQGEGTALCNLGLCYDRLGDYSKAIEHHEQSLAIARDLGDRQGEGTALCSLGLCYDSLGNYSKAIEHHEQYLAIARDIGVRQGEGTALGNLGLCYCSLGDYFNAIEHDEQALAIARDIGDRYLEAGALVCLGDAHIQARQFARARDALTHAVTIAEETGNKQNLHETHFALAEANLLTDELSAAHEAIQVARAHHYPPNNAATWTLMGIIQSRHGEREAARDAFARGLSEADVLLAKSARNTNALYTRALALCGLVLCENEARRHAAAEAFRAARGVTRARGVVARTLNRFDALAQADPEGLLAQLRNAAAGDSVGGAS